MNNHADMSLPDYYQDLPPSLIQTSALIPLPPTALIHRSNALSASIANTIGQSLSGETPAMAGIVSAYSGHQFGTFNPALGDGRAMLLGRLNSGANLEVGLKGCGKTAFSYGHDGRLSLTDALKEYLISHALMAQDIPSIEPGAIYCSGARLPQQKMETAAFLIRLAPSFLRVGHLEYLSITGQHGAMQHLIIHCMQPHFDAAPNQATFQNNLAFFSEVVERWAKLAAKWQAQGFCHGTLNSDNFSVLGLSLDCGGSQFMSRYDPLLCPNAIDKRGRYAFNQQSRVILFNLTVLAQALTPLLPLCVSQPVLATFKQRFNRYYAQLMAQKLGLRYQDVNQQPWPLSTMQALCDLSADILQLMFDLRLDYHRCYQLLAQYMQSADLELINNKRRIQLADELINHCGDIEVSAADVIKFSEWLADYQQLLQQQSPSPCPAQPSTNPRFTLRTSDVNAVVKAAHQENFMPLTQLIIALRGNKLEGAARQS